MVNQAKQEAQELYQKQVSEAEQQTRDEYKAAIETEEQKRDEAVQDKQQEIDNLISEITEKIMKPNSAL